MAISQAADTCRTRAAAALLDLVSCLPLDWDWCALPGLRVLVVDGRLAETVVAVADGFYVAGGGAGIPGIVLARYGRPGAAVDVLERMSAKPAMGGVRGFMPGDGAA